MHRLDWSHMEVLLAIHSEGSLSGAARKLRVDQSTISRRLSALEHEVGQPLFARSTGGVHATTLAEELIPLAHQMSVSVRRAQQVVAYRSDGDVLRGHVRIASLELLADHAIIPELPGLLEEYPGLTVSLEVGARLTDMARLDADLAIRLVRPESGDLLIKRLDLGGVGVFASAEYARAHQGMELRELDWVSWDEARAHLPEAMFVTDVLGVTPRLRCNRITSILRAARAGVGAAVFGATLGNRFDDLVQIPASWCEGLRMNVWLVRPAVHRDDPAVNVVASWIEGLFMR
ncbi:MAG: LysR family transcriptional regulator [Myxococcota bacterium]